MDNNVIATELAKRIVAMARERTDAGHLKWTENEVVNDARRGIAVKLAEAAAGKD